MVGEALFGGGVAGEGEGVYWTEGLGGEEWGIGVWFIGGGAGEELVLFVAGTGEVRERVLQVSGSLYPVMIEGEEGTGRSVVAKAVHYLG